MTVPRTALLLAAAAFTAIVPMASAQKQIPGGARPPGQALPEQSNANADLLLNEQLNINFPGGTLNDFLAAVRNSRPSKSLNVIVPDGAAELPIPPLTLTRVEVPSALNAMEYASARDGRPLISVSRIEGAGIEPVFALQMVGGMSGPRSNDTRQSTFVLSLNQITKPEWAPAGRSSIAADVVLTAIESAIQTASQSKEPPTLKFHRESGLLIVKGTANQLEVAKEVVRRLEEDIERHAADQLGQVETRAFPLAHINSTGAVDVLRSAFPVDVDGKSPLKITSDAPTNAVVVNGPSSLQTAIAAVLRVIDRAAAPSEELEAARARLEAMQQEIMSFRKLADDQMHQVVEARAAAAEADAVRASLNARAEEYQARERAMRDQALKFEETTRDLAAQKQQLEREREDLIREIEALRKAKDAQPR